jgi:hypothetical protein
MSTASRDRTDPLSLPEMLRVMDVATTYRLDRELAEEQLNSDQLKARLRDRMLEAAKSTGEEVTPAEVDAAIASYFGRLHTFHDPRPGLATTFANLYVRRHAILKWGGLAVGSILLAWWLFLSPRGPLSSAGRTRRQVETLTKDVARRSESIRALARDPVATVRLADLDSQADAYRHRGDPAALRKVDDALAALEARLGEEYTVSVLHGVGQQSAVDRYFTDKNGERSPGYYLIVEARRPDGSLLKRRIRNSETEAESEVMTWAERVPKEVYDRLARDKREDGVLNETAFAVKARGHAEEEVVMPGPDGKPLKRLGQITKW